MPHLHLSIQHGDDIILKRMKRRHLSRDVMSFVNEARRRRPDVVFGADFISGFPTEDYNSHLKSIRLIKDTNISFVHVFPFSLKSGTLAEKMPQIKKNDIILRSKELREVAKKQLELISHKQIGSVQKVLVEKGGTGYSTNFTKIYFSHHIVPGQIVNTKIINFDNSKIIGTAITEG